MLTMVAHAQVGGAFHVLPPRAVDDLLAAQLIVHLGGAAPRAAPLLLDGVRDRSDAAPVATCLLAALKPGYRLMLSVQRGTERRSEAADSSRYTSTQHGNASPIVLRVLAVQILSCGALLFALAGTLAGRPHRAYEWNKCARNKVHGCLRDPQEGRGQRGGVESLGICDHYFKPQAIVWQQAI